ncbi:hypothetical protein GCM10008967_43210 [Bacillus carboniphilus]|uniref:N-acetyltransferase domain-containing protein n=1 Tax=Bacillus carboniphilus TaxID=86663 RepID=A0ABP3GLH2_9BACI
MTHTKHITFVEYSEKYAGQVAQMWNESRDSWGGDQTVKTAEYIQTSEANSGNITTFLALDEQKVVGYCGLSEYRDDTGALYIPLLNVHPDYHGQRLGKQLVFKAIEKTIELGWPRLDLYTWPGNTKAVPLYKKCGFFWEDRDDRTHLLNFMPTVMNHPLSKTFFEENNWYSSLRRSLEVKPDGRKENGFTYFTYHFEGGHGKSIDCDFELTGRSLRSINTNDYCFELSLPNHELIEGEKYEATLRVVNKKGVPLSCKLSTSETERIKGATSNEYDIKMGESIYHLPFQLKKTELGEPTKGKSHPLYAVHIEIDGIEFTLSVGVKPKQAAKLKTTLKNTYSKPGSTSTLYAEIESFLDYDSTFDIIPIADESIDYPLKSIQVSVERKGVKVVEIPCVIKKPGIHSERWIIKTNNPNQPVNQFSNKQSIWIPGVGSIGFGETDDEWSIGNGFTRVILHKETNLVEVKRSGQKEGFTHFRFPLIGKPYSSELSKKRAEVSFEVKNGYVQLNASYNVTTHPGLQICSVFTLKQDGLLEYSIKLDNNGEEVYKDLFIDQNFYHSLTKTTTALDGEIILLDEPKETEFVNIDFNKFSEPWLFTEYKPYHYGISWPKEAYAFFQGWLFHLEHTVKLLKPNESIILEPITVAAGTFQSWEEFRSYTIGQDVTEELAYQEGFRIYPGDHNPVMRSEEINLHLQSSQLLSVSGRAQVKYEEKILSEKKLNDKQVLSNEFKIDTSYFKVGLNKVKGELISPSRDIEASIHLLKMDIKDRVKTVIEKEENHTVWNSENGPLKWAGAPTFFPGVHSLKLDGTEWLATSYPTSSPKLWWNPWSGGIRHQIQGISNFSVAKEHSVMDEVVVLDQHSNEWTGLKVTTNFVHHLEWKGLQFTQYFVSLPGVPIIAVFASLQHPTKWIHDVNIMQVANFLTENGLDPTVSYEENRKRYTYRGGIDEHVVSRPNSTCCDRLQLQGRKGYLQFLDPDVSNVHEWYLHKEVTQRAVQQKVSAYSGEKVYTRPHFYISHPHPIVKTSLTLLNTLSLKEEGSHENN